MQRNLSFGPCKLELHKIAPEVAFESLFFKASLWIQVSVCL